MEIALDRDLSKDKFKWVGDFGVLKNLRYKMGDS